MQFRIKNVVFADSFQFLSASLDTLVATLRKSGKENFVETWKYMGDDDIVFEKGHFPYTYFDCLDKLDVTALPPKNAFYNDLTDSEISDRDYRHAQDVWTRHKMTTFKQYHDFYVTTDVFLLADCFEAFRQAMLRAHGLDCLHFPSLPSLSCQMALKMTQVELDLITDPDMFLMIESGIRGGLSYVIWRFAEANHPTLPNYRLEEPISYLCNLDANSLCATCQTFSLPVGDFRFLTQSEIDAFDVNSVSDHPAYSLCPEHLTVEASFVSPTLEEMYEFVGSKHVPCDNLISNLRDKTFYVTHYRCLKFYLANGMRLVCTHRIVSFTQRPFMRPLVEYCNEQRQNAETEFESALYKLLPYSFFRKDLRESAKARQCETRVRFKETRHGRGQSHVQAQNDHKFRPGSRGVDASPHNDESSTRSRLHDT